jgi:hypothetical protein
MVILRPVRERELKPHIAARFFTDQPFMTQNLLPLGTVVSIGSGFAAGTGFVV